jgi:hypothetical protein
LGPQYYSRSRIWKNCGRKLFYCGPDNIPGGPNRERRWQALHRSAAPKCLVFGPAADLGRVRGFVLPMARRYLLPGPARVKFGIGDAAGQGVAKLMQSVGVRAEEARARSGELSAPSCRCAHESFDKISLFIFFARSTERDTLLAASWLGTCSCRPGR